MSIYLPPTTQRAEQKHEVLITQRSPSVYSFGIGGAEPKAAPSMAHFCAELDELITAVDATGKGDHVFQPSAAVACFPQMEHIIKLANLKIHCLSDTYCFSSPLLANSGRITL